MKFLLLSGLLLALVTGCALPSREIPYERQAAQHQYTRWRLPLGDTNVFVLSYEHLAAQPTFINLHDDENTSVEAGKAVIEESGGRLIELTHSGQRHLRFIVQGKPFAVDPNRIFSPAGIRATLERNGSYASGAHWAVKRFAARLIEQFRLGRQPVIIALHNTVAGTYSIESYRPGAQHAKAAADLHISPRRDRLDFFYVTDWRFFDFLQARDFNVVLQDNGNVPDDGSLSVFCGREGIPYLNIEAELGELERQKEMVRVAREMVEALGLVKVGGLRKGDGQSGELAP